MTIKPMLAQKADESKIDWKHIVYIQPKLDGVRCLFTKNGAFSRSGKKFKNLAHIEKDLKSFFNKSPNTILDGELYNHDLRNNFEKIISLVRKQKPKKEDRLDASNLIQYHIYDVMQPKSYGLRYGYLSKLKFYNEHIKLVDSLAVKNMTRARRRHQQFLDKGYEGSILRLDKKYENKRSWYLMKLKDFKDSEARIIGWEEGKGKRKGTLGKWYMEDDKGVKFGCPPGKGYDYKTLTKMTDEIHDYIGRTATFTYFERTKAGSYRHPLFKGLRDYE
tara:strand:+ start:141 stop:968 length:828 start_codon:yes stop_codon:yes gene_type:complete